MRMYLYEMHRVRNGKRSKANVLDYVVSTKLYEHDLDTTPVGDPYGLISGINIVEIPSDTGLQKGPGFAAKKPTAMWFTLQFLLATNS